MVGAHPTPEDVAPGWVYVVGGPGYQKWAYFLCPTGSGEIIQLSLMSNHRPRWQVNVDWFKRPTIDPSVRQLEGSYAHFWLRKGTIDWCPDTGQKPRQGSLNGLSGLASHNLAAGRSQILGRSHAFFEAGFRRGPN